MKIRTKEQLYDRLTDDLGWRKKELTTLYNNVHSSSVKHLPTSLRCAIVMLYAHWEGFIKNASEYYLNYIKYQDLNLDQLNSNLLALSLKQKISEFSDTKKATLHVRFVDYFKNRLNEKAVILDKDAIRTSSNLNSTILQEIFASIGLDITSYELKFNLIDSTLLRCRNNIAHGNFLMIDKNEYVQLHHDIVNMLDLFLTDISNSVDLQKYLC